MKSLLEKMALGVSEGVFPGGALLVAHQEEVLFEACVGSAALIPKQRPMKPETIFDLASLSKPLVTGMAIAMLIDQKKLKLNDAVGKYLPVYQTGNKRAVTLFHLLNHSSGLPAWQPYFKRGLNKALLLEAVLNEALVNTPGDESLYSDIGFILLGLIVEQVSGLNLDVFFQQKINGVVHSKESFFVPLDQKNGPQCPPTNFAATEDSEWRREIICGTVNDDNTYMLGGVAGHAGLFSTLQGVSRLTRLWSDSRQGRGPLSAEIALQFTTRQETAETAKGASWGLSWDSPSCNTSTEGLGISSSGHHFSPQSFGHLGYAGTSIWVDPLHELTVILLSNRVHPSTKNKKIRQFRPALHDLVVEILIKLDLRTSA